MPFCTRTGPVKPGFENKYNHTPLFVEFVEKIRKTYKFLKAQVAFPRTSHFADHFND